MKNINSGDISNKKFNSVFRGYNKNEVNNFLLILSKEFEILENEIIHLKEKISDYKNESDKFKNVESSLISTLKTAEDASLKINDQAKKDADLILKNSELEYKKTINNANLKIKSIKILRLLFKETSGKKKPYVLCKSGNNYKIYK